MWVCTDVCMNVKKIDKKKEKRRSNEAIVGAAASSDTSIFIA